jgi:hypothetical protein
MMMRLTGWSIYLVVFRLVSGKMAQPKQDFNALLEMQVSALACQGVGQPHPSLDHLPLVKFTLSFHATTARTVSRQSNARSVSVVVFSDNLVARI